jgi:cytochrome c553
MPSVAERSRCLAWLTACLLVGFMPSATLLAGEIAEQVAATAAATPEAGEFFEREIRPILVERCQKCHGPDEQKGGLRLDSRAALLAGGDSGPVLEPGHPDTSLLVDAVATGQIVQMPPDGKLPAAQVAALAKWIKLGAPWPDSPAEPAPSMIDSADPWEPTPEERAFWAFQPPQEPALPAVRDLSWCRNPIDRFVLAELEKAELVPAPPADKRALLRRATFDLTGLPPTPEEMSQFLSDERPDAFEHVVDRLLASPRYGERWGRHWLDVARYADSNGLDENLAYAEAYRYRDYVVRSFNGDKPYDQFLREQLAGDLLPESADETERLERIVATGFLCLGAKMLAEDDPVKMEMDIIDEQIDTLGTAVLGMTFACARCHHHKFDPISQADYYALAGIFKSTQTMDTYTVVARWHERPLEDAAYRTTQAEHAERLAQADRALEQAQRAANSLILAAQRDRLADYLQAATHLVQNRRALASVELTVAGQHADTTLHLQAEDYAAGNVLKDRDNYGAGIGVVLNQGTLPNLAEYQIEVPTGGVYQIEARYAALESRPIELWIDEFLLRSDGLAPTTGSWYPEGQTWHAESLCYLSAGPHRIRIQRAGPFPHIDRLALVLRADLGNFSSGSLGAAKSSVAAPLDPQLLARWTAMLDRATQQTPGWWGPWLARHQLLPKVAKADARLDECLAQAGLSAAESSTAELAKRYVELLLRAEPTSSQAQSQDSAISPECMECIQPLWNDSASPLVFDGQASPHVPAELVQEIAAAKKSHEELAKSAPVAPQTMAVQERATTNVCVHIRGSHLNLGAETPRRFPTILAHLNESPLPTDRSGRLELADWLVRPDHPLTSRVMVNRLWRWHFGAGLVASTDNFGKLGERPSHPQLLDWLALRFVESNWSVKAMHRLIMHSSAYQLSSEFNAAAAERDPGNRLLWHFARRRLEAEEVRDALLAVSGQLDTTMGGSLLPSKNREYVTGTASTNATRYDSPRRSIYLPVIRSALYDLFQAFDFSEPSVANGDRPTTTVAPQALFFLNSELVESQSRHLAQRLLDESTDNSQRIESLFQSCLARSATPQEVMQSLDFLRHYQQSLTASSAADSVARSWQALCRAVLGTSEFVFLD